MVPIQNVKMTVGPIWNTGGTETEISVPVLVLGPQRAWTEMGGERITNWISKPYIFILRKKKYPISKSIFLVLKPHWFHEKILCN